jgi:inosine-uridine nucleoside N-ribohydrolase
MLFLSLGDRGETEMMDGLIRRLFVTVLIACTPVAPPASAQDHSSRRLVLIDDDLIGLNGVVPLLVQSPDVDVLGITTTSGSVWRDTATAYALRTLELIGRTDIPVVPGAILPLLNSQEATKRWEGLYGRLVFKGPWTDYWPGDTIQAHPGSDASDHVPDLPTGSPTTKPSTEIAAAFLVRMARAHPGEITLFATGPMTNIAIAQSLDPGFASNIKEIIYMGGSLLPHQALDNPSAVQFAREFINSPRREFNIRWDPEAARIVAHASWKKMTMIPVDPSTGTQWTSIFLASIRPAATPLTKSMQTSIAPGFPMWDEIAAMAWLRPEIVTRADPLYIDFDIGQTAAYGDTLSWTEDYRPNLGERQQTVIRTVDRVKMEAAMRVLYMHSPAVAK